MIDGVQIKKLVSHDDERGFFRELIRNTDNFFTAGFGQLSHSLVHKGVIKAWHGHVRQYQWTYVVSGRLSVVIYDARENSRTYQEKIYLDLGEGPEAQIYVIPPGVVHGYRCLTEPAHVIYVTSGTYDPEDEVRIPLDDKYIGFDWSEVRN